MLALPFTEYIGWLRYDRDECLGPERREWSAAQIACTVAQAQGAHVDVFNFLEANPWNKILRPMPSVEYLEEQLRRAGGK